MTGIGSKSGIFRGRRRRANRQHHGDLFNGLVRQCENIRWQIETERFRGLEIDYEFELGGFHYW